jgi:hypothetical protein
MATKKEKTPRSKTVQKASTTVLTLLLSEREEILFSI